MKFPLRGSLVLFAVFGLLPQEPARAITYTFENVADSSGVLGELLDVPAINAAGTVVFHAPLDDGSRGIFLARDQELTPVATNGRAFLFFSNDPVINREGRVAFHGRKLGSQRKGGSGIFTSLDGSRQIVALTRRPIFRRFRTPLAISDAGSVAFRAELENRDRGIFVVHRDGAVTTIAKESDPQFIGFGPLTMNAAGTVAFRALLEAGGKALLTSSGGDFTTIARNDEGVFRMLGVPTINASGMVAFQAELAGGGSGIFKGDGGSPETVALDINFGPTFQTFVTGVSFNDARTVAFAVLFENSQVGLFTGPDPVADKVIRSGDTLFSSTVFYLNLGSAGLNESGQISFRYSLTDGRQGIAIATPAP